MATRDEATSFNIFLSYAHEDARYIEELKRHFSVMRRGQGVEVWSDRDIEAGDEWKKKIRAQLDSADVIIFFVSAASYDSEFIMETEFPRALARRRAENVRMIPFLVEDFDYEGTDFANYDLRVKHKSDPKPLQEWRHRATAYKLLVKEIREFAESRQAEGDTERGLPRLRLGFWMDDTKRHVVVGREGSLGLLATTLRGKGRRGAVALVAASGAGKSTIAREYVFRHAEDYDMVAWVEADNSATLAARWSKMAENLNLGSTDQEAAKARFRQWLATNDRWLVVLDSAADVGTVRALLPDTVRGHVIITSQIGGWSGIADEMPVDRLSRDDAAVALCELSGDPDSLAAIELGDLLQGHPVNLKTVADTAKATGMTLRAYLEEHRARLAAGEAP